MGQPKGSHFSPDFLDAQQHMRTSTCVSDHLLLSVSHHLFTKTFPHSPQASTQSPGPRERQQQSSATNFPAEPNSHPPSQGATVPRCHTHLHREKPHQAQAIFSPPAPHFCLQPLPDSREPRSQPKPPAPMLAVHLWPAPQLEPCRDTGLCLVRPPGYLRHIPGNAQPQVGL